MSTLQWRSAERGRLTADGCYNYWYELRRENTTGTWWTAWFHDGSVAESPQRIGQGNFVQVRAAAIKHHSHVAKERA